MIFLDCLYLVVGVRALLESLLYWPLPYLDELRLGLRLRLRLHLVEGRPRIRLAGPQLVARLVGLRLVVCLIRLVGLRLATRLVVLRLAARLVGLRLAARLVGLRLVARLVGLRVAARLIGLRLVVGVWLRSRLVLVELLLEPRPVLVRLRAPIRLRGLRLTYRVGVRLLDLLVPPGERIRRKTRGDRGLTDEPLVRGEYDLERRVRWVRVGERYVYAREGERLGGYGTLLGEYCRLGECLRLGEGRRVSTVGVLAGGGTWASSISSGWGARLRTRGGWRLGLDSSVVVRNSFVSIYFSHFELFLPTNTHPPNTCPHFRYDLTTCSLPLISFRFHHSHQVRTVANTARSIRRSIEEQEAIYSRGSSPGTFSHPIPYRKASLMVSLNAHSSTNS